MNLKNDQIKWETMDCGIVYALPSHTHNAQRTTIIVQLKNIWQLNMCDVRTISDPILCDQKFEHSIKTRNGWHLFDVPLFVIYLISVLVHIS